MKEIAVTKSAALTKFLDALNHPLRSEIEQLRSTILTAVSGLTENIKWNGPNYCYENADRITMRIQPPKQIQLIFHRGANKLAQPTTKLINDDSQLLVWKENDRAVATFTHMDDIVKQRSNLIDIVNKWVEAAR
jgi:hypothetical protein